MGDVIIDDKLNSVARRRLRKNGMVIFVLRRRYCLLKSRKSINCEQGRERERDRENVSNE